MKRLDRRVGMTLAAACVTAILAALLFSGALAQSDSGQSAPTQAAAAVATPTTTPQPRTQTPDPAVLRPAPSARARPADPARSRRTREPARAGRTPQGQPAHHPVDVSDPARLPRAGTPHQPSKPRTGKPAARRSGKPKPVRRPSLRGSANVGERLTFKPGKWSGKPKLRVRWSSCKTRRTGCRAVRAARRYRVRAADAGRLIRVRVTARNRAGRRTVNVFSRRVKTSALRNLTAPTIAGSTVQGHTLTASPGDWTPAGAVTFSFRWQRGGVDIPGASTAQYTLTGADVGSQLRVIVTASSAGKTAEAASALSGQIAPAAPVNLTAPAVTGAAQAGRVLTARTGDWTGSPAVRVRWQRDIGSGWTDIPGATAQNYTAAGADVGARLRVHVTASNVTGTANAVSAATAAVRPVAPANTTLPALSGTPQRDQTLTVSTGSWAGAPQLHLRWQADSGSGFTDIPDATGTEFTPTGEHVGARLRVHVTATNVSGTADAVSAASAPVLPAAPANISPPSITGTVQQDEQLTAAAGGWEDADSFDFQWQRDIGSGWTDIPGATLTEYTPTGTDVDAVLRVRVTASGAGGSSSAASAGSVPVLIAAPANTISPSIEGPAKHGQTLTADPGVWSHHPAFDFQWQRDSGSGFTDIPGATGQNYTAAVADLNAPLRVQVRASNPGGDAQRTSAATSPVDLADFPVEVHADNPYSYWDMDGTGPVANQVPGGPHLELNGTAAADAAITNSSAAVAFDGTSWARGPVDLSGTEVVTVEAWMWWNGYDSASDDLLFEMGMPWWTKNGSIHVDMNSSAEPGTISIAQRTTNGVVNRYTAPQSALPAGEWHHAVFVFNAGNTATPIKMYVDGAPVTLTMRQQASDSLGDGFKGDEPIYLMSRAPTELLGAGRLDEVVIYKHELSAQRVADHFNSAVVMSAAPFNLTAPTVSGTPEVGETLTLSVGQWTGAPDFTLQWQRDDGSGWTDIPDAGTVAYTVTDDDLDARIRARVTATNAEGSEQQHTQATTPAENAYSQAVLSDSPYAHWDMNVAGPMPSRAPNGPTLYLNHADVGFGGLPGGGLSGFFDGAADYGVAELDLTDTDTVTVETWVYWDAYDAADDAVMFEFNGAWRWMPGSFIVNMHNSTLGEAGTISLGYNAVNGGARRFVASQAALPAGGWHHVAFVFDAAVPLAGPAHPIKMYVDATPVTLVRARAEDNVGEPQPTAHFGRAFLKVMARDDDELHGAGRVDELAVYKHELSPAQLAAHVAAGH